MPKVVPHPATYLVPAVVAVVAAAAVIAWLAVVDDPTTGEVVLAIAAGALALATLFLSIETLGRRRAVFAGPPSRTPPRRTRTHSCFCVSSRITTGTFARPVRRPPRQWPATTNSAVSYRKR